MNDASIGWIAAIIIGGLAGWIASGLMKTNTGLFLNIVLGIIGAVIASFLFGIFGVSFGGWIGYLIAGVIGACILIGGVRAVADGSGPLPLRWSGRSWWWSTTGELVDRPEGVFGCLVHREHDVGFAGHVCQSDLGLVKERVFGTDPQPPL